MAHRSDALPQHVVALTLGHRKARRYLSLETKIEQMQRYVVSEIDADELEAVREERDALIREAQRTLSDYHTADVPGGLEQ